MTQNFLHTNLKHDLLLSYFCFDPNLSCFVQLNSDRLVAKMWETMGLDRGGSSVDDFCNLIHRSSVKEVKYVLVWGTGARHNPQNCGLVQVLQDEDAVQIVKKKVP
ncbi:hypothetical protein POM88_051328 [Heracleum sosnowskyi]|uniref:TGS domain-containing protein n=1 Tax=Heracleum sosnowskyi TaxID=360622 RepID=A0AAD8GZA9_9APIA|nr:hypothetical protein POM88_051328 [Heracleum sosnowskyi]